LSNFESELTPRLLVEAAAPRPEPPPPPPAGSVPRGLTAARRLPSAPAGLEELIRGVAAQVQLAPALLHAVIAAESAYDARAVSPRGAMGLMQLMPATARRFGARDPFAPRQNLLAGASYLKWLLTAFDGDLELALAAYNAGEQAVINAGRRIPSYPETRAYVPRVLEFLRCASEPVCERNRIVPTLPPRSWGSTRELRGS